MDKKQRVTDCFQVVRDGKKRMTTPNRGKPAVHAKGKPGEPPTKQKSETNSLSALEKLREFDLNWHFGPCSGITRLERWQRAQELKLSPPETIRQILLNHPSDPAYQYRDQ
ncbi:DNA polymerase delta subunit 4 isoform X2 [Spea bombifrons]|uniref:DNA polymerase delta subunit 4 isoform X2 n=1 Tax=Spea bombifrons TaxID=233779 RepID=UPI00234B6493|nr:DNA polymerase delta subunit 4 isoform X2 [Spea bombifrons]